VVVLGRFVSAAGRRAWLPDLAHELDTASLRQVLGDAAGASSPNVVDRLAEQIGAQVTGGSLASGELLFLMMLLLDDVGRLVEAGHCDADLKGALGYRMLQTVLTGVEQPAAIATG
jgi:hypothetical protein